MKKNSFHLFDNLDKICNKAFECKNSRDVEGLTRGYQMLLSIYDYKKGIESHYEQSETIVNLYDYGRDDLECFSEMYYALRIEDDWKRDDEGRFFCSYLSAAANKLIETKPSVEVRLKVGKPGTYPSGLGMYQKKGKLIIEGTSAVYLGYGMTGGTLEFHGDAGNYIGNGLQGGNIKIYGKYGSLSNKIAWGNIHLNDKKIFPR